MKIGILSDTHDRLPATIAAVSLLHEAGCEFLIHCGDVGSEQILDQLVGIPAAFVFGNNDWDRTALRRYATDLGLQCLDSFGTVHLAGKAIAVAHGDDSRIIRQVLESQQYDYLLQGHTHMRSDRRVGRTHVINAGALHRAAHKTVATLDLETDALRSYEVQFSTER